MKDKLKILIVIGIVVGILSAIIPFARIFNDIIGNRIYFRGILLGSILVCIGSATVLQGYHKAVVSAVGFGAISLFITSTLNLIHTDLIKTENYFWWTIYVSSVSLLVIILIKVFGVYIIRFYYVAVKKYGVLKVYIIIIYNAISKKYKACLSKLSRGYRSLKEQ